MTKMTRRGNIDNIATFEHICDSYEDLNSIPEEEINLGSIAIVLVGESGSLDVFMADSQKQWHSLLGADSSDEEEG